MLCNIYNFILKFWGQYFIHFRYMLLLLRRKAPSMCRNCYLVPCFSTIKSTTKCSKQYNFYTHSTQNKIPNVYQAFSMYARTHLYFACHRILSSQQSYEVGSVFIPIGHTNWNKKRFSDLLKIAQPVNVGIEIKPRQYTISAYTLITPICSLLA